jgi:hypothetical protein
MVISIRTHTQDILIVIIIILGTFFFLGITGNFNTQYHFLDDHQIIRIANELKTGSTVSVAKHWLTEDLNIRFRPLYFLHRVAEAKVFGNNLILWSVWTAILACATFTFFYLGMRKLKFSVLESLLFIMLTFVGQQMAIWWKFGPNETIGMFFLGLTFYFITNCNKRYTLNTVLFCLCLIFASWCKESFTIVIPAFIFFKLWYEKNFLSLSIRNIFRKNFLVIIPLIVMIINLYIIIFVVGTDKIEYAGLDPNISTTVLGVLKIIKNSLFKFDVIILLMLGFLYYELKDEKKFIQLIKKLFFPAVFAFLIVVPNLILYAKSGMSERYFLPSTVGLAFLIVYILRIIKGEFCWLNKLLIFIIILGYSQPVYYTYDNAVNYAKEGMQIKKMLTAIVQNNNGKTNNLLVANPAYNYEWSFSLKTYLSLKKNINLYAFPVNDVYEDELFKGFSRDWHTWFKGRNYEEIKGNVDVVIFFDKNAIGQFFKESEIDSNNYINLLNNDDNYAVYKKV